MTNSRGFSWNVRTIGLVIMALGMIAVSIYLTQHFFEVRYPKGLSGGSLCNINEFFNCDKVTNSPLAAPMNTPISVFGGVIGLFLLLSAFIKSEKFQNTLFSVLVVNFAGCLFLFVYSLTNLSSICLFCSLYYVLSGVALFLSYAGGSKIKANFAVLALFGIVTLFVAAGIRQVIISKNTEIEKSDSLLREAVLSEFTRMEKISFDASSAPGKLNSVANAPLKMVIFSDFECPACRALSEQLHEILATYKDKIDISYFFYPLDKACNPYINREKHIHACKAAAAALCLPNVNFYELHETFFNNQDKFTMGFVESFVTENKLDDCVNSDATLSKLKEIVLMADVVQIRSTPTFLLNGAKFEGVVPFYKLKIIMDSLIAGPAQ